MPHSRTSSKALWGLFVIVLLALAACQTPPTAPDATVDSPVTDTEDSQTEAGYVETLRLPGGGYWGHPSPFGFNRGPGYMRASLLFDTLVWRDAGGETIPWLATDWELSADGLTWTFTLRDDVYWQDGEPLTVDDVVFSFNTYIEHPGTAWFMAQINEIKSVSAVSEKQVAITLARPFAPFIATTAESTLIFPKHIWEGVADPRSFTDPEAFVGSSAYRLSEYSQEEGTYLFEANPDFFLGAPYVRRIEFIPTSDNLLSLINREIAAFDKFGGVTDEMLEPFGQAPYAIKEAPGEWGMFLYFNLAKETPLRDVRVRQAIAYAVDRQAMVERVLFNFGEPGNAGFLPPANPYTNPDVQDYAFDPAQARALLAEAGYDGTPIRLTYSPDWLMASTRVVEIIEAGLQDVGIPLEHVTMDLASIDAAAKEGNYELIITGFGGLGGDPDQLRRNFASGSSAGGFARAQGYVNPDFDALAESQVSMSDEGERREAINQMQAILAQDLPALPLYYTARVVVYDAEVFDNWTYTPGGFGGGIPMPYNKAQFITR